MEGGVAVKVQTVSVNMANWHVSRSIRPTIGFSGENDVVIFKIITELEEGVQYYLDILSISKKTKNTVLLSNDEDGAFVELTDEMLGSPGVKDAQVVGYSGEQKKKSNIFQILVENSINATEEFEDSYESVLGQIAELVSEKQNVLTAGEGIDITNDVISVSYPNGDMEEY